MYQSTNSFNANMYNTSNVGQQVQQQQMQQYILTEFLKTPEGRKANEAFAIAQKDWWEKLQNPQAVSTKEESARLDTLESKLDQLLNALGEQTKD